jgi:excisionase family DNA binding protein
MDSDQNMTMPNANFLTIVEASAKLGKSPRTIHRWLEEGRLPGHKVDVDGHGRWVVDIDNVKDDNTAMTEPADAQAELLDLREEVAWLREQLQAKDTQMHELRALLQQQRQSPELDKRPWWAFWRRQ